MNQRSDGPRSTTSGYSGHDNRMSRAGCWSGGSVERNRVETHISRQPSGRLHLTDEIEPPIILEDVSTGIMGWWDDAVTAENRGVARK
jgi:hypothetical protein